MTSKWRGESIKQKTSRGEGKRPRLTMPNQVLKQLKTAMCLSLSHKSPIKQTKQNNQNNLTHLTIEKEAKWLINKLPTLYKEMLSEAYQSK